MAGLDLDLGWWWRRDHGACWLMMLVGWNVQEPGPGRDANQNWNCRVACGVEFSLVDEAVVAFEQSDDGVGDGMGWDGMQIN